jgi:hypothetical protein
MRITFTILCLGLFFLLSIGISFKPIQIILAQNDAALGNEAANSTISPVTPVNATKKAGLFEGQSIKILIFTSWVRENQWEPIDNYTSNGYDIKSILPVENRFYVILERENE